MESLHLFQEAAPGVQISLSAPFTAERSSLSPLQLIAKASCAALELAIAGMNETAIELLESLAETWK